MEGMIMSAGIGGVGRSSMGQVAQPAPIDRAQLVADLGKWVAADPFTRSLAQAAVFQALGPNPAAHANIRIDYSGGDPEGLVSVLRKHLITLTVAPGEPRAYYDQPPAGNGPAADVPGDQAPPSYNEVFPLPPRGVVIAADDGNPFEHHADAAALPAVPPPADDYQWLVEMFGQASREPAPQQAFDQREPSAPALNLSPARVAHSAYVVEPSAPFLHRPQVNMVQASAPLMMQTPVAGPLIVHEAYPPEGAAPQQAAHLTPARPAVSKPSAPSLRESERSAALPSPPDLTRLFGHLNASFEQLQGWTSDLEKKNFGPRSFFNAKTRDKDFKEDVQTILRNVAHVSQCARYQLQPHQSDSDRRAVISHIEQLLKSLASVVVDKAGEQRLSIPKIRPVELERTHDVRDDAEQAILSSFNRYVSHAQDR